jgi:hypothetical protein
VRGRTRGCWPTGRSAAGSGGRGWSLRCWSGWPRGTTPTGCTRLAPRGMARSGSPRWPSPGPPWLARRGGRDKRITEEFTGGRRCSRFSPVQFRRRDGLHQSVT